MLNKIKRVTELLHANFNRLTFIYFALKWSVISAIGLFSFKKVNRTTIAFSLFRKRKLLM